MSAGSGARGRSRGRPAAPPSDAGPLYQRPDPPQGFPVVVSHMQGALLLRQWRARNADAVGPIEATSSVDLGLSTCVVTLDETGVRYPQGVSLSWASMERIVDTPNQCFEVVGDEIRAIVIFSETTGAVRSLMPTEGAPTTLVSGLSMHRIKGTEPWADSQTKARAIAPIHGRALDTTTGLGYTAILAARSASEVVTIELDPTGIEVARRNPWSHELFDRPNIRRITGDAFEVVNDFAEGYFDCVLHDPPYMSLAGELYSGEMYGRLWRVLRRGGKLFHYIGDPSSGSGARVTAGVIRRLQEVGFRQVTRRPETFGVTAVK